VHPAGERRQVTVLFADLAGFTTFVHESDAEDVRDIMERLWVRLDELIAEHGGITEKHIGDAVLAIFGARQAREDDPVRAVRTALAIQAFLRDQALANGPPLQMRIGIHTGLVVVGPLASSGELAATGDAVNLANRLEQNAPIGGVLISQDTYRNVYGFFDMQALPPLTVKGLPEPVQTYVVLRAKARAVAALWRGVEGAPSEMIGRQAELNCLKDALQNVVDQNRSQLVTIVAEAGLGKTCLFREFQKHIELLPYTVRLFYGHATAEMTSQSFSLVRDLFCARFEIQDSDPAAVAKEKLEWGLRQLVYTGHPASAEAAQEWQREAGFIGQLLGLDFSAVPEVGALLKEPDQLRHRAFQSLRRFFAVISQTPPADAGAQVRASLLVAEDLHWGDRASLDLIEYLATRCAEVPLLIVCLARPMLFERSPRWGEHLPKHTKLTLEPLSRTESHTLVESILRKTPHVPQALRELIVGGAEGIPFFIEEIIKMLIDEKVIVPGPEQWRIEPERLADARVPPSLTGVLQARLDRLTPLERAVLQRASVIGRVFWDEAVERLSQVEARSGGPAADGHERPEVLAALGGLRRKELILRREGSAFAGATEYNFKHELLRNVAYESLLKKSRREHHAQVGAWLIERSGERVNEFAGLVAGHYEQASQPGLAAEWYGRAGQQARAGYAPVTAIESFRKALALLPNAEKDNAARGSNAQTRALEWQEGLGEVLGAQAQFAEALEVYEQLRKMAEKAGDALSQARAWNGMAYMQERLAKNRASIECAEHAEALARAAGEPGRTELVRSLLLKGWAFYRLSDAPAVLGLAEQTSRLCAEFADHRGLATSLKLHGVAHLQLGHFREADDFFARGLALYQELGDKRNTAAMFNNLAENARARGDYQAAVKLYEQALALARQIGNRDSETIYLGNLCGARLGLNQFREVEEDLRQAIAMTSAENSCALADTYTLLSEACLAQGKVQDSLAAGLKGLTLAVESENDLFLGSAWRALGQVAAVTGSAIPSRTSSGTFLPATGAVSELLSAQTCFNESLLVFRKINAEGEQARTLRAWGELELREHRPEEARKKFTEARNIFLRLGAASEAARTDALASQLLKQSS
jgi:class 3 adenylate cyclase/tetratricopeptide (TPR) repeat protein